MTNRTNIPRLDRLSALLEGARPQIAPLADDSAPPSALLLELLTDGRAEFIGPGGAQPLHAPALVVARPGSDYQLTPLPEAGFLRFAVRFEGPAGRLIQCQFDEALAIACDDGDSAFAQIVGLICAESQAPRCGHPALLQRAGEILFIALLRRLIEQPQRAGLLFQGLADPRLARALVAIHERPAEAWTLERLAETAGMSRTAFATGFRDKLGQTPGEYLTALRLALARQAADEGKGLKEAARLSGYGSASALSRALARSTAEKAENRVTA